MGAGASWWWEPVGADGSGEIKTEVGELDMPEPALVSGCYITSPITDVSVDSFDAECHALMLLLLPRL